MVWYWPFGREDANTPKSFEKSLATLSDKIQRLQARDDTLRALHRRLKVLFTLYSSFIYILVSLILLLVTGYEKWTAVQWSAIAASPVAIFAVRYLIDFYFDWREGNVRTRLESKTKERDAVIKKLKDAMRYDSTKELLDKYGGATPKKPSQAQTKAKAAHNRRSSGNQAIAVQRTGFAPPPTANIPGRTPPAANAVDARTSNMESSPAQSIAYSKQPSNVVGESFAPNAFDDWQPPSTATTGAFAPARSGFLDRVLDLLVGEDESAPRNRIVLLCTSCRTVNGQAPPGTRSLEDLGRWRCVNCKAWNGVESETTKLLNEAKSTTVPVEPLEQSEFNIDDEHSEIQERGSEADAPAGSTRSRAKQRRAS